MRGMIAAGVKVQACVTSPPYFGLRDYGHPDQLGLEETPEQYIANMVEVFRLVRDLLADDGVLWLNIGDSYAGCGGLTVQSGKEFEGRARGRQLISRSARARPAGEIKTKDLIGIPWMLAFALRADGWYLRQDIIWSKPNPMPESVTDRCTKSHEYIFLLSKSEKYYYDNEAVKEPISISSVARLAQNVEQQAGSNRVPGKTNGPMKAVVSRSGNKERKPGSARGCPAGSGKNVCGSVPWEGDMRNKRSVWTVATVPYSGAHFATFPAELIEPCILAGSRVDDIVLDPFFGSGTTGQVAQNLGRQWIGCELNRDYEPLQNERTRQGALSLVAA